MPTITALLLVNLSFGVLTRAAPQLNIFAVGFPVIIAAGYVVIMFTLWTVAPQLSQLLERTFGAIRSLGAGV